MMRAVVLAALLAGATPAAAAQKPDPLAGIVRATAVVAEKPPLAIDLLIDGPRASLRVRGPNRPEFLPLDEPAALIDLLADRRAAALWPALIETTGSGLEIFRARLVERAFAAFRAGFPSGAARATADSSVGLETRGLLQYATVLAQTGDLTKAIALLDRARGVVLQVTSRDSNEWNALSGRLASYRVAAGDRAGAIEGLARDRASLSRDSAYAINLDVTRAAYLAEEGRFAEALALIDAARAEYDTTRRLDANGGLTGPVSGSDRQFAWIRGCALHGLGRRDEARAALAPLFPAEEAGDRHFYVQPNHEVQLRAFACMRDVDGAAALLAKEAEARPIAKDLSFLQPAWRAPPSSDAAFWTALRAHPAMRALFAKRLRVLPPELTPALNAWRP